VGGASGPGLSAEDEAALAEFSGELDDFLSSQESPLPKSPPPKSPSESGSASDLFDDLPPMMPVAAPPTGVPLSKPAAAAKPVEYESEYRVKCLVCGSILYAKAEQAGRTVTCSDCHSPVKVPPPPKKKQKPDIDLETAETFQLDQTETRPRRDPFQRSAEELLAAASQEEEEASSGRSTYEDVPSVSEWFRNVFGVFLDPGVIAHWIGLSVLAAVPAFLALSMESPILILGLFPLGFFLGAVVVSCGFAILQSVANEEPSVSEWPVFDPVGWIGQLFVAIAAALVAAVPAWALASLVFGSSLMSLAITMLSVYALFPFVVLSMLDMQTPLVPFSSEVARSITKCEEAWGGFYFSSGVLFAGMFLFFVMMSSLFATPVAVVPSIFVGVGGAFVYFSMIGRLAYAIGQSVNAPPMKNDVDRNQPARRHDGSL
jgi:DNA-directed RNA polymerase subunit M/transcription elongation factor TFIIS